MPCNSPLEGWWSKSLHPTTGNRTVVFNRDAAYTDRKVEVPCGQCIGCRIDKTSIWATRCVHETLMHETSYFVTLTYDEEHLPADLSVSIDEHQRFMKRLRKNTGQKNIRFYMCGEYGSKGNRPHYHYLLFGLELNDLEFWHPGRPNKHNGERMPLYRSLTLENAWQHKGFVTLGQVTVQSAQYVAGYVRKKITGKAIGKIGENGLKPYELYDSTSGLIIPRQPEFSVMSRNPGIGASFYEKYGDQIRRNDMCIINGKRVRVPRYYDERTKRDYPDIYERNKRKRVRKAKERKLSRERLYGREDYLKHIAGNPQGALDQ